MDKALLTAFHSKKNIFLAWREPFWISSHPTFSSGFVGHFIGSEMSNPIHCLNIPTH